MCMRRPLKTDLAWHTFRLLYAVQLVVERVRSSRLMCKQRLKGAAESRERRYSQSRANRKICSATLIRRTSEFCFIWRDMFWSLLPMTSYVMILILLNNGWIIWNFGKETVIVCILLHYYPRRRCSNGKTFAHEASVQVWGSIVVRKLTWDFIPVLEIVNLGTRAAEHKRCNWACKWLMVAALSCV